MEIKIKKLAETAMTPTKAHATDAGFDLYASRVERNDYGQVICHTDIAFEIPPGHVGLVFPRSSICKTSLSLTNCVGVIDSGYRGEVKGVFRQHGILHTYRQGDRFAQLIVMRYPDVTFVEVDELAGSDRGDNGYGSSGQ